jgi:hypothetical protein
MLVVLIVVITLIIITGILLILWPKLVSLRERKLFARIVGRKVYSLAEDKDFYVINQVALSIENKIIHFDHILFTNKFIYCIGTKYYDAPVSGNYEDAQWLKYNSSSNIERIKNPMLLATARLNYIKSSVNAMDGIFVSVVLVNDTCILDEIKNCPPGNYIMNLNEFRKFVEVNEKSDIPDIDQLCLEDLVQKIYKKTIKNEEKNK